MKYISQKTIKGNTSYSFVSQEDAEINAASLDSNGCVNCINCVCCINCDDCNGCINCIDCIDCINCIDCIDLNQ